MMQAWRLMHLWKNPTWIPSFPLQRSIVESRILWVIICMRFLKNRSKPCPCPTITICVKSWGFLLFPWATTNFWFIAIHGTIWTESDRAWRSSRRSHSMVGPCLLRKRRSWRSRWSSIKWPERRDMYLFCRMKQLHNSSEKKSVWRWNWKMADTRNWKATWSNSWTVGNGSRNCSPVNSFRKK